MVAFLQGRQWATGDVVNQDNLNSSSRGGVVHALDSGGLFVDVEALSYILDSVTKAFAAVTTQPVIANDTNFFYIDDSNVLVSNTTGFPISGCYWALAIVTTNTTKVLQVIQINQAIEANAAGVTTVTANSPLVQTGTGSAPIIDLPPASGAVVGSMSTSDFSKLAGIEALADVTDESNVAGAGAAMKTIVDVIGDLLVGSAVDDLVRLAAGASGDVLTSNGPASLPSYQTLNSFASQILVASSVAGVAGGSPLSYSAAGWDLLFSAGTIAIDGTDKELINLIEPGLYLAFAMMYGSQNNRVHQLQFNLPPQTGKVKRGYAFTNLGAIGTTQDTLNCIGAMQGPGQLALETTGTNFGTNGVAGGDAMRNILMVIKVAA